MKSTAWAKKKEGEKARAVFFCANLEGKYEIII